MPSGHSSGGHFGGGSFSGSRGGHFGGSHGSFSSHSHSNLTRSYRSWFAPRVMVFGGRTIYMGSGRASATSVLGIFVVLAIIATAFAGLTWSDAGDKIGIIKEDYAIYQTMAEYAVAHPDYQTIGSVTGVERYEEGGNYCIFYTFKTADDKTVEGYSFYVYHLNDYKKGDSVVLAIDTTKDKINMTTESVPLDFKDANIENDDEYIHYQAVYKIARIATMGLIGFTLLLIVSTVLVPLTAKKATAEQIAENKQNNANNQSAPEGTWRCEYCNALNDNGKERCDGCGAKRQK